VRKVARDGHIRPRPSRQGGATSSGNTATRKTQLTSPSPPPSYAQKLKTNILEHSSEISKESPSAPNTENNHSDVSDSHTEEAEGKPVSYAAMVQKEATTRAAPSTAQSSVTAPDTRTVRPSQQSIKRLPPRYLKDGQVPSPHATWTPEARIEHEKKHGKEIVAERQPLARSAVDQNRPGFKDRVNKDVYRFNRSVAVQAVTAKNENIKSTHPRSIESFDRLAVTNEVNRTGKSVSELGELGSMASASNRTARDDVLEDPKGRRYNSRRTDFPPK
jgi:hypothetical protein